MPILKFRAYFEEDETVYRDILIRPSQSFSLLHEFILKAYEFDSKHQATFFRSNDKWQRGREITLAIYDKSYQAPPLLMAETTLGSEIKNPNQRFIYVYDFEKNWSFLLELIQVIKEEDPTLTYPVISRNEGLAPSQYGTKALLGEKFAEIEEKYDLSSREEGFSEKDEEGDDVGFDDASITEEEPE